MFMVVVGLATQVYGEPRNLNYDKEPCPVLGYDYLCQQIKCPYSKTLCGRVKEVKLSFRVNVDGTISKVRVLKSAGATLLQLAIMGVGAVEWQPVVIEGKNVPVRFELPVHFNQR